MYSPQLLDHFEHPRNAGVLPDAQVAAQVENPVCGDVLKLSASLRGEVIAEIRFQAKGCVPSMACGSAVAELARGKTLAQAATVSLKEVLGSVGGVPPASAHAAQLAIDALRGLIVNLANRRVANNKDKTFTTENTENTETHRGTLRRKP